MDKSKIYIDLSKCTEEEQKHVFTLLPDRQEHLQYRIDQYNTFLYLDNETGLWWVNSDTIPKNKTELTYPEFIKLFEGGDNDPTAQLKKDKGAVSVSTDLKKPLIDRVKYELRRYTELAKRMDELIHECNLEADYSGAKEAEIKRNCYNRFINDLKQLVS